MASSDQLDSDQVIAFDEISLTTSSSSLGLVEGRSDHDQSSLTSSTGLLSSGSLPDAAAQPDQTTERLAYERNHDHHHHHSHSHSHNNSSPNNNQKHSHHPSLKCPSHQKLYHIVNEICSSEAKFVDTLRLLNVHFRAHLKGAQPPVPVDCVDSLLKLLPPLQTLNENLLDELNWARDQWPHTQKIAHVIVRIGPFLKHYSSYIRDFETIQKCLADYMKRYPQFAERVRSFEANEDLCQKLSIQDHLLKPIQRIPQYRLLLKKYLHHLKADDADYQDTVAALEVVSRVVEHANQSVANSTYMQSFAREPLSRKLLKSINPSYSGQFAGHTVCMTQGCSKAHRNCSRSLVDQVSKHVRSVVSQWTAECAERADHSKLRQDY